MIRHPRAGHVLVVLALVSVVACFESGDDPAAPASPSFASTTIAGAVEVADEAVHLEDDDAEAAPSGSSDEVAPELPDRATQRETDEDVDGNLEAQAPLVDESVEVPSLGREENDPITVINPDKSEIDPAALEPGVVEPGPVNKLLLSGSYRPDIDIRFDAGETRAIVFGSVGLRRRQVYVLEAAAGQLLTASLHARPGVWLDVRLGDDVILSAAEETRRVEATLPSGGGWRVSVVSSSGESTDFALTVRVLSLERDPAPVGPSSEHGNVVYLTFDDGPHPANTPQVLDILARHDARATFFVIGSLVERHPDLFQRIVSEGHTVANHTWNHENLAGLSREEFDETISRTQEILGDHATPCLRPPYAATGEHTREWAAAHGLEVFLWTVSANDWLGLDAEAIADRIVGQVTDGSIVLMHDGGGNRPQTVLGLEIILDRLSGQGLRYEPLCR